MNADHLYRDLRRNSHVYKVSRLLVQCFGPQVRLPDRPITNETQGTLTVASSLLPLRSPGQPKRGLKLGPNDNDWLLLSIGEDHAKKRVQCQFRCVIFGSSFVDYSAEVEADLALPSEYRQVRDVVVKDLGRHINDRGFRSTALSRFVTMFSRLS